jgi:D-glycero-D-manno-heptose 1,7-bisphosphate phosphatase
MDGTHNGSKKKMKWVILDRDGVINEDSDAYIKSAAEWHPVAGSLEAIARLNQAGYRVCVASNQSGLGRGLFDYDAFAATNALMQRRLGEYGGRIDAMEFAPEAPEQPSDMRKPEPGMLSDLARRLGIQLEGVWFIGDKDSDLAAARAAGAKPVLVRTGKGRKTEAAGAGKDVAVYDDLAAAVSALLAS